MVRRRQPRGYIGYGVPAIAYGAGYAAKQLYRGFKRRFEGGPTSSDRKGKRPFSMTVTKTQRKKKRKQSVSMEMGVPRGFQRRPPKKAMRRNMKKYDSFYKYGSIKEYESGGIATDSQCVYIGHGTSMTPVLYGICRAVVRELFRQKGDLINNWNDQTVNDLNINFEANYVTTGAAARNAFTVTANSAYETAANQLYNLITGFATAITIQEITLSDQSAASGAGRVVGTVKPKQFKLRFLLESQLTIQNSTQAATPGGADPEATNETDVNNQPIYGKFYYSKLWNNGFQNKVQQDARYSASVTRFYPSDTNGTDQGKIYQQGSTLDPVFKKPIPGFFFDVKRVGKLALRPGDVKTSRVSFETEMYMQTWFDKYFEKFYDQKGYNCQWDFGCASMFAMERLLDNRVVGAPSITVNYEITQKYCVSGKKLDSVRAPPILFVQ